MVVVLVRRYQTRGTIDKLLYVNVVRTLFCVLVR